MQFVAFVCTAYIFFILLNVLQQNTHEINELLILTRKEGGMVPSFIEGNEAIARGAIAAGCSFFAGYPITPATSIYQHMLQLLPPLGGSNCKGRMKLPPLAFVLVRR